MKNTGYLFHFCILKKQKNVIADFNDKFWEIFIVKDFLATDNVLY